MKQRIAYDALSLQVWPALAAWFGVETAPPQKTPLTSFMPKHEKTWKQIREKYTLKDIPYDKACTSDIQSNNRKSVLCRKCRRVLFFALASLLSFVICMQLAQAEFGEMMMSFPIGKGTSAIAGPTSF